MKIITEKLQNLWNSDEVRILVLMSLGIQIALIFLAPLRKRITNIMLTLTLWLLYLTADNVATLGLGNISHQTPAGIGVNSELTVLWAPFLLVHLGGPDTITSYSIEDNELWWRHLLGLLFQVIITVYIFIQSPPTGWLWIPTIFVFIPGLIKFAERTHALRIASKDNIKDKIISELRPGNRTMKGNTDNTTPNPVQANQTTEGNTDNTTPNPVQANRTTEGSENNTPSNTVQANGTTKGFWGLMGSIQSVLFPPEETIDNLDPPFPDISKNESAAILEGFRWFNIYKRLLVDVTFPADLLMKSQDRFSDVSSTDALRLVAIELSFLYDYLHTKAVHMHSILGRVLRYFSLVSIIAAFIVFHHLDMQKYGSGDIIITYILFGAGLSLEVIATILLVLSDWTVVTLKRAEHSQCVANCIPALVKRITLNKGIPRWARTIGHFNLVDFSLRDRDTYIAWIMRILKIKNKWDNMREKKLNPLLPGGLLEEIMVTEAKRRAQNVHIYKVLVEARAYRGDKTLERHDQLKTLEWSMKREFDESIILWHLATDICYYEKFTPNQSNMNGSNDTAGNNGTECETSNLPKRNDDNEREVSRKTSNYMVYLLTQHQSMMQLGYGKTRFEATCAVVKKKFKGKGKLEDKKARDVLKKNGGATKVSEENNASVSADSSQPTNKMGTSVLKKIWANLRRWGTSVLKNWSRRKREEDKGKRKDEEATQVSEENNASVSADGSQPTNKMGTSVLEKIWANLRCWGRRKREEDTHKRKDEETTKVSEENNASVSADGSQPTNKMGTSVLKKIWANLRRWGTSVLKKIWAYLRCWGRRKREDDERKRKEEDEMGEQVLRDSLRLAKELQDLKPEIKWKLISQTWMEMLGYAAIHCDSYQHAKSLSRGGELLTHLWLLMSQLGVVEEHKMQQYQPGTV